MVGSGSFEPRLMSSYRSKRNLPYVFDAFDSMPFSEIDLAGFKLSLPEGTERKITSRYQQITVPAQEKTGDLNVHSIMVDSLDAVRIFIC